uniref:Uncharacterized protein n=1 Tax=Ceratitis capitata TaxID=7213 RepID=W8BXR3_CERCA
MKFYLPSIHVYMCMCGMQQCDCCILLVHIINNYRRNVTTNKIKNAKTLTHTHTLVYFISLSPLSPPLFPCLLLCHASKHFATFYCLPLKRKVHDQQQQQQPQQLFHPTFIVNAAAANLNENKNSTSGKQYVACRPAPI